MEGASAVREPAERARPAPARASAEDRLDAVAALAWLAPDGASLAALCRPVSPSTWDGLRHDPGAVLLALRHGHARQPWSPRSLASPALLEAALRHLDGPSSGFVDWDQPSVRPVYQAALRIAEAARLLAGRTGRADAEAAWTAGLLAPLGWLAACAVDPGAVGACLDGAETASDHWRAEPCELARRLGRRWRLPAWLDRVLRALDLPVRLTPGGDPELRALVQLAVAHVDGQGASLGLVAPAVAAEAAASLNLALPLDLPPAPAPPPRAWRDPAEQPLLRELLAAAAENRRLRDAALHRALEDDNDSLHRALREQCRRETERLEESKLSALAELAAGAGHEINNPLAVISGQAQYLLGHLARDEGGDEKAASFQKPLQTIVAQTRRIHGVLRDLMQFARPAPARPDWFDLAALLGESAASVRELAEQRRVRLEVAGPPRLRVRADAEQVRLALVCLARNAVEAAPADGWARLRLEEPAGAAVEVTVEDSGPGPDDAQRPHLFDPFYSGRAAGRGRGLGLPIAWRLARQQGGAVRLEPRRPDQPTRFVLRLPFAVEAHPLAPPAPAGANGRH
jgi:signal transduction histidine kinase